MHTQSPGFQNDVLDVKSLYSEAAKARMRAYAPYSHFWVGAALLGASGTIYHGCNIENASYALCLCAERVAIAAAVSAGERAFTAIAICGHAEGQPDSVCFPCGACRQVLTEFCPETFRVVLSDKVYTLSELMPYSFRL